MNQWERDEREVQEREPCLVYFQSCSLTCPHPQLPPKGYEALDALWLTLISFPHSALSDRVGVESRGVSGGRNAGCPAGISHL